MSTRNFIPELIAGAMLIAASLLGLCLTLERFLAAAVNLWRFHFQWPAPVYVVPSTIALFGALLVSVIAAVHFVLLTLKWRGQVNRLMRTAQWMNAGTIALLVLMWSSGLLAFSTSP